MTQPTTPVREVASWGVTTVDEKLTLRELAAVLHAQGIGVALVEGPDGSRAVVSERDIIGALADDADPDEIWSADVASDAVVYAPDDEPIIDVARRMEEHGIRHVAIVAEGRIVGIVSARDLLPIFTNHVREWHEERG